MWLLLSITTALAHSPHDVSSLLSFADDGTLLSNDSDLLALSHDQGQSFDYRYWFDGVAACVIALDADDWIVGGRTDGAWITHDGGLSFTLTGGPDGATTCARRGDDLFMGGGGGVWTSRDGESWVRLGGGAGWLPRDLLALDGDGLLAVDTDGIGWSFSGRAWEPLGTVGLDRGGLRVLSEGTDGVLVGGQTSAPMVESLDGGETWREVSGSPEGVRVLATRDGVWLAATEDQAVWVSQDAGDTWLIEDEGLDPLALGNGGPHDGVHYFNLAFHGDRWYLTSFEGLYWKLPEEPRWSQGDIDIIPRVRTVQWTTALDLLVGSYGGGVYQGTPGGQDWREVSAGIGWPYPKQVVSPDDGTSLFVASGTSLYVSRDDGQTWDTPDIKIWEAGDQVVLAPGWPDDPRVVMAGRLEGNISAMAHSEDGGYTWASVELPGSCSAKPRALAWRGDTVWGVCGTEGGIYRSPDGGFTWEKVIALGREIHIISAGEPMLFGSDDGVWALDDDDDLSQLALPDEAVFALDRDASGLAWAGVAAKGLATITPEGAVQWMGFPQGDLIEALDVAEDGRVAVALRDGAWVTEDGGRSWSLGCPYDRVDDRLQQWTLDGFTAVDDIGGSTGIMQEGHAGARAILSVDGVQIRVVGGTRGAAELTVQADGGPVETLSFQHGVKPGLLWGADLGEGRHQVVIDVINGTLLLDGAERWRADAPPLAEDDTADTGVPSEQRRCGCGGGEAAWILLLLPVAGLRRRYPPV